MDGHGHHWTTLLSLATPGPLQDNFSMGEELGALDFPKARDHFSPVLIFLQLHRSLTQREYHPGMFAEAKWESGLSSRGSL